MFRLLSRFLIGAFLCAGMTVAPAAAADILTIEKSQEKLLAGEQQTIYLKVAVRAPAAPKADGEKKAPLNVAVVLDTSGSMSGQRIDYARKAARNFIDILRPMDRVALVTFSDQAVLRFKSAVDADKTKLGGIIDRIQSDGSTALYAGVEMGGEQVAKHLAKNQVDRVILLSDGEANVGPQTPKEIGDLGRKLAGKGIAVTTIGLGEGYNEEIMVKLAAASDGNHAFAMNPEQLEGIFQAEFLDADAIIGRDAELKIELAPGVKPLHVYGYASETHDDVVQVKIPNLLAEQEKYVIVEAQVPAAAASAERLPLAKVSLSYHALVDDKEIRVGASSDIAITTDKAEAAASVNKPVLAKAALQKAVTVNEEALAAINSGDLEKGKQLLKTNADDLQRRAGELQSDELKEVEKQTRSYQDMAEDPAQDSRMKKSMTKDAYKQRFQKNF